MANDDARKDAEAKVDEAIKQAEDALGSVDIRQGDGLTATAGVGYAILALAKVLRALLAEDKR